MSRSSALAPHRLACLLACAAMGCQAAAPHVRPAPLEAEGELLVYRLAEPGAGAEAAIPGGVEAVGADGLIVPLDLAPSAGPAPAHHLVASGRVPPGDYDALLVAAPGAPPGAPRDRIAAPFSVARRHATLLTLAARPAADRPTGAPPLVLLPPSASLPRLVGACSSPAQDALTLFDARTRRATGVLPTGRAPSGLAIDERAGRAYVALSGDDQVAVLDLLSRAELARLPLRPGDGPVDVALAQDGRLLLVVNAGSASVSFVDPVAGVELERLAVGGEPVTLVVDRPGRRAYLVNRGGSSIAAIDVATRAVVATVATDAEPIRARLDRTGTRLLVIHARSPYVTALSLPDLATAGRALVGMGLVALEVDSRSGLVYVASSAADALQVLEPQTLQPVRRIGLPGPAAELAIDDLENTLFAVVPTRRLVSATDLATGATVAAFGLAETPARLALTGARR